MKKLECLNDSFAGEVDERVVQRLSTKFELDPDYLTCMQTCNGARPIKNTIDVNGIPHSFAQFLTLYDFDSEISGAFQPDSEDSSKDIRAVDGVSYLVNGEHQTAAALFGNLMPFGAPTLRTQSYLTRCEVNLFCFDCREKKEKPPIVLWLAENSIDVLFEWEELSEDEAFNKDESINIESVDWDSFVVPVANSFAEFVEMLYEA